MYARSNSGTILALGICSLVICGLLGPIAWSMGKTELARIDRGELPPDTRGQAQAGMICGIIATILLIVSVVIIAFLFIGTSASSRY
jgi:hypothetical protein